jgi:hypothetical protein
MKGKNMPVGDIEHRLAEMREYYPSDDHTVIDEAIETIRRLREQLRKVQYVPAIKDEIEDINPAAMFIDGMDDAIVGFAIQWGSPALVVYDAERVIEILSKDMSPEEASEFFSFNIECAYVGPGTPLILYRPGES